MDVFNAVLGQNINIINFKKFGKKATIIVKFSKKV